MALSAVNPDTSKIIPHRTANLHIKIVPGAAISLSLADSHYAPVTLRGGDIFILGDMENSPCEINRALHLILRRTTGHHLAITNCTGQRNAETGQLEFYLLSNDLHIKLKFVPNNLIFPPLGEEPPRLPLKARQRIPQVR